MNKLIIILFIFFGISSYSQDQTAKDVLDRLSEQTESYKDMSIEFLFTFENKVQGIEENQNGKIILQDNIFQLEFSEQLIFNDGETQWIYSKDINEITIIQHDNEDDMMNPQKLFKIYEKNYKYKYIEELSKDNLRQHLLELYPEEENAFKKIQLYVDITKNQLKEMILFDKNGGKYTYKVIKFESDKLNKTLVFDVKKYGDAEIIDLR